MNPSADRLKERGKAFLREVVIVREHFGNISFAHRRHGYAICETVALVGAFFVQSEPAQKRFSGLWNDEYARMAHGLFKHVGNDGALSFSSRREIVEELTENLIGRYQHRFCIGLAEVRCRRMPHISRVCQGDPIETVRKDFRHLRPQRLVRLGEPYR